VGAACGANPIWLVVPCHRAIGSDGHLVGYAAGLERKGWLLAHERARGARPDELRSPAAHCAPALRAC
jgi:methylated-DNA-[protein]-cysteine S-methyltransferase